MDRVISLALDVLLLDAEIQPRETMSSSTIAEYAALYADGIELAPIVVYQEGSDYWVADGFHRVAAARRAGIAELVAEVRLGGKRDALFHSCGANKHGKPLTRDDKRRVVTRLLEDNEWGQWSDREIARQCGVGHAFVSKVRKDLSIKDSDRKRDYIYTDRWGHTHTMDTSAMGAQAMPEVQQRESPSAVNAPCEDAQQDEEALTETAIHSPGNPARDLSAGTPEDILVMVGLEEGLSPQKTQQIADEVLYGLVTADPVYSEIGEEVPDDITRQDIETAYPPVVIPPIPPVLRLIADPPPVVDGKRSTFNKTNEMVDWAKWTWNPITGCLHNCIYCYARDIAERFYPEKFVPTFHPDRLHAPHYTKVPPEADDQVGYRNVFVCSMADLFGKWVPQEWIDAVMAEVRAAPQWNFLFLTKFPQRLETIDWPENAWVGTSVDEQYRVKIAERAFRNINASVKWLSCEPLRERLTFDSLDMFDWVVLGGQSKSTQAPAFQPPWEWVEHLWQQARAAQCLVYWKPNLATRPQEYPGQQLVDVAR